SGYMTVIRIYAEVIEIEQGGKIYLAGKGGQGGNGGASNHQGGQQGQDGNTSAVGSTSTANNGGGGGGGATKTSNYYGGSGGGGGGSNGTGGNGGRGARNGIYVGGTGGTGGLPYLTNNNIKPGSGGGGGSAGYDSAGNPGAGGKGGEGGGAIQLIAWNIYVAGIISTNGTDGKNANSGSHSGSGGGGGGSGGIIVISGCNVSITGMLYANGGNGGNGSTDPDDPGNDEDGGGGGGGGGGAIYIYYDNAYTFTGSYHVNGGTGGNGPGIAEEGGNGANGNIFISKIQFTSFFLYATQGSYISPVIDAGRIAFWNSITWCHDTHFSGTSASLYVRYANDTTTLASATWTQIATYSGQPITTSTETLPSSMFGRFFQYNITLSTTTTSNSPTVYHLSISYHKPKLLIVNVTFNPLDGGYQRVTLYNNDTMTLSYTNLYLNASSSSYPISSLTLNPGEFITINLGSTTFFNIVVSSGDYLFLNDSTSSIPGVPPNGTIDFVNWTNILGLSPPSDGGTASANLEWSGNPVNLLGFNIATQTGINRTWSSGVPAETDTSADWNPVSESQFLTFIALLPFIALSIVIRRKKKV
ncbi:MAG: hypothetical protein ACP5LE_05865, partial [Thermoplasmata archaeon]